MKAHLTILLLACACTALRLPAQRTQTVSQELAALGISPSPNMAVDLAVSASKTQTYLPAKALGYNWDTVTADWDTTLRIDYTYQNGTAIPHIVTQELKDANGWRRLKRESQTWDANGYLKTFVYERWINGQWDTTFRSSQSQDSYGNLQEYLSEFTSSGPLDTFGYEVHHLSYNNAGALTSDSLETWDSATRTLELNSKKVFAYLGSGELTSQTLFTWTGNAWQPNSRRRDYTWFDYATRKAAGYYLDFYTGINWSPVEWHETNWSPNGSYAQTIHKYNLSNSSFEPWRRDSTVLDNSGNRTLFEVTYWVDSLSLWDLEYGFQYTNYYDSNGAWTSYDERFQAIDANSYSNFYRHEYLDFALSSGTPRPAIAAVAWAPHPVGEQAHLMVESEQPGTIRLEILDVQGKLLTQMNLAQGAGRQVHALEMGLSPGLYLYRLHLNGELQSGRMLVR